MLLKTATPEKLPQEEHLSQEPTEKPKKKKKANKKWKTDSNNNEELNSKRHATLDKQTEKEKEKEELLNQSIDKVTKKRKPSKDPADKPLSKKAKRDKFLLESGKDEEPAQKSVAKGEDNKKKSKQIATKNAPRDHEAHQKSSKTHEHKERHLQTAPTKLEHKEKGERAEQPKKYKSKEKPPLSNVVVRKGHVSDVEPSYSSDSEENNPTYEHEEVDHENDQREAKEEVTIHEPIVQEELALKFEDGLSEKRTYQKALGTRMSTRSFSSLLNEAQVEAIRSIGFTSSLKVDVKEIPGKFSKWLVESFDPYAVCFRLLNGQKFSVTAFDVYATLGVPLGRTKIIEITKSSMDEEYDEVDAESLKEWKLQKNTLQLTRMPEFILAEKDGGKSFKRNFIIYLVNCFFSKPKNSEYNKSILKYVKDLDTCLGWCKFIVDKLITSIRYYKESMAAKGVYFDANNDLCASAFYPTLPVDKPDGEAEIPGDTLIFDASIIVGKGEHCEDVVLDQPKTITKKDDRILSYSLGLGLSQPYSQRPTTCVPDPSTTGVNEDYRINDDDDGAPLRNTSQVNCELNIKKPAEKRPKEGDKPSSKKGEKKESAMAYDEYETTDSRKPKLTKKVVPKKHDEKRLGAAITLEKLEEVGPSDVLKKLQLENLALAYCSPYVIWLTKLDNELSQDDLTISEYVFNKVEDVDDSEPLFDSCDDKEATRTSMLTLKPGEQLEMNVTNIWSSILNDWERKSDLSTPSRFFMSCDQSANASHSTYCSIITALAIITKILSY
ncbi:LOW QUALITY PROTEIN: hypothetical protein Cgig2_020950 [Carnegiea gigantea]|uniref:Uncharacterized protein n=1 Tax=Carnegiea gigantea TaxID=171969 RepID=A0A9Q1GRR3_9CARY|nr:LOW QUALITY PROTEIN: hypothetical protein Cgig2_020950 [Carnegiea gigantea]